MYDTRLYKYHKHNNSCMKVEKRPIQAICLTSYLIKTSDGLIRPINQNEYYNIEWVSVIG